MQLKLRVAMRVGDVSYVGKWLRDGGREIVNSEPCVDGMWALTVAAGFGQPGVVSRLLKAKATADPPSGANGDFPLLLSCCVGSEGCVSAILEANAQTGRKAPNGQTAMQRAVAAGHLGCARLISEFEKSRDETEQNAREASSMANAAMEGAILAATDLTALAGLDAALKIYSENAAAEVVARARSRSDELRCG